MNDFDIYANYFPAGMKVSVGIPLANAGVFRDWAIIHEIDEDFVSLQLSRDQLPHDASLHVGQILDLRGGKDESGYSCRAIIVAEGPAREVLLRLIGEIVSDELREFYRIDAFLPIKYYISSEQNVEILKQEWGERREQRQAVDIELKNKRWDSSLVLERAALPPERRLEQADEDEGAGNEHADKQNGHDGEHDGQEEREGVDGEFEEREGLEETEEPADSWDTIIPLAANISGGGVRIITHQQFESGVYVLLEILVPMPRRIVDIVARVITANRNFAAGNDREYFNTGLQFVFIDERDRDAIISHISNVQLKRIRQLREQFIYRDGRPARGEEQEEAPRFNWARFGRRLGYAIVFLLIVMLIGDYFRHYAKGHPKNEIEEIFEGGIRKYLEKFK
ncbi:PilZ domain-containing protein [Geobacter sp. FeAm09]|uniref:PilZ-like domain-containing protein n=1 Tax=Geobacter sp. FeAm09 TaxID=2597769 RepID=UPI0011ED948A|nr:PilZ-like domain-containing protein [Geobacter sp. FeAm09]QEM68789.1 PilZ domain-containing protein [Geobacter sp. FeAm09]